MAATIALLGLSTSTVEQNVNFGFKTGLNISNFTGGDADRNSLIGFHIGGFGEFNLIENFHFNRNNYIPHKVQRPKIQ